MNDVIGFKEESSSYLIQNHNKLMKKVNENVINSQIIKDGNKSGSFTD